jgi:hypothetical protein
MRIIGLTKGKQTLVDDSDYLQLIKYKWHYCGSGYAARRDYPSNNYIYMHRFILGVDNKSEVDHINCDTLDNRRENLRKSSRSLNMANTKLRVTNKSGIKGVSFDKNRNKWSAEITVNYKKIHLGRFYNKLDASRVYDFASVKYFGDYSRNNKSLGIMSV